MQYNIFVQQKTKHKYEKLKRVVVAVEQVAPESLGPAENTTAAAPEPERQPKSRKAAKRKRFEAHPVEEGPVPKESPAAWPILVTGAVQLLHALKLAGELPISVSSDENATVATEINDVMMTLLVGCP